MDTDSFRVSFLSKKGLITNLKSFSTELDVSCLNITYELYSEDNIKV